MTFNTFVHLYGLGLLCSSGLLYIAGKALQRRQAQRSLNASRFGSDNVEFRKFQRLFYFGYVPCLFADSLQAPYLYYLYMSYGFVRQQIAVLYVVGFVSSVFFGFYILHLVQRVDRRILCLIHVAVASFSCMCKTNSAYGILLMSRILDGLSSSLLASPFVMWYAHEHVKTYDFPVEWLPLTYRRVSLMHAFLSTIAGYCAEFFEGLTQITAFPFILAIPVLLFGGFMQLIKWKPNKLDKQERHNLLIELDNALRSIANNRDVLLLSIVHALFEASFFVVVFLWTPLLSRRKDTRITLGGIYASLMSSMLLGMLIYRLVSIRLRNAINVASLLPVCCACATTLLALCSSVISNPDVHDNRRIILIFLCTYESAVGCYFSCASRIHSQLLNENSRLTGGVMAIIRAPTYITAGVTLLLLLNQSDNQQPTAVLIVAATLTGLATVAACFAVVVLRRRKITQNKFTIANPSITEREESDEDVFM